MSDSIKNIYTFQTESKILASAAAASTFEISNDILTDAAVTLTNASILLQNRTGSRKELMQIDATGWTATIDSRGITPTGSTSSTLQYERPKGTICKVVVLEDQIADKTASETISGNWTYSGDAVYSKSMRFPVYADATARDAAITVPANGMMIYNTALGVVQQYVGWSWVDVDTWAAVSNASTTVAGKKEDPTYAEHIAGTDTWGTGATMSSLPSQIARSIQEWVFVYAADVWGDDTYVGTLVPAYTQGSYPAGMRFIGKFSTANTGACTLNLGTPWAVAIKTKDGNDPQTGAVRAGMNEFVFNGTNWILMSEDFATSTAKWVVELATDAETYTRTDTARAVTPANLAAITQVAILQTTRVANTADGAVTVAHWLSQIPKRCEVVAVCKSTSEETVNYSISHWFSNGSTNMCSWAGTYFTTVNAWNSWNNASAAINILVLGSSGESQQTATITFDATNVTLTRDFTEDVTASTETIYVTLLVHT